MDMVLKGLLGRSRREALLTLALFASVLAALALASVVPGIGYYHPIRSCTGVDGEAVELNPLIYLPYEISERYCAILGGRAGLTLADKFASSPDLYAWTVVWWIVVSFPAGRLLSAAITRVRNRGRRLWGGDNPGPSGRFNT